MMVLALWMFGAASAAPDDLPEEEDEIDVPTTRQPNDDADDGFTKPQPKLVLEDDDVEMHDFVADEKKKAPPADWFHLDFSGKAALADNFDIQIAAYNDQYVVVELPVLVATGRAAFVATHPGGLSLVAEVTSGPIRQVLQSTVTPEMVAETTPTVIFLKTALPNSAKTGEVRYLVKSGALPVPPPPATGKTKTPPPTPAAPAPIRDLFARTTVYRRP
jgi:hypothetical protein